MKIITFFNGDTLSAVLTYQSVEDEAERKTRLRYYDLDGDQVMEFKDEMVDLSKQASRYCEENGLILWGF